MMGHVMHAVKNYLFFIVVLTIFLLTTRTFAVYFYDYSDWDEDFAQHTRINAFKELEEGVKKQIFMIAADKTHPADLRSVCKDWRHIIDEGTTKDDNGQYVNLGPVWKELISTHYAWFFNGKLIFRPETFGPEPKKDEQMKMFKFSEAPNPLKHTLNLSGLRPRPTLPGFRGIEDHVVITTDISFLAIKKNPSFLS